MQDNHVDHPNSYRDSLNTRVDSLISGEQYTYSDQQKEAFLLPIIKEQLKKHYKNNIHIKSWIDKIGIDINKINNLASVPMLPTQMFKYFDLQTSKAKLQRTLFSSATTSQTPSKIPIDGTTAKRQTKAMLSIIKNFFPGKRRPFLVIDTPSINQDSSGITARGAAIRGFSIIAKEMVYAFDDYDNQMVLNMGRLKDFFGKYKHLPIFAIGFTYIIWSQFLSALNEARVKYDAPQLDLVHGGGWKKLIDQQVSKESFSTTLADLFGTSNDRILDYYGMVEQTGIVFIDCQAGRKHAPNFADVKIRNFYTLKENDVNEPGYIEIISVLPDSYPGMSILTEDVGEVLGHDDCPCGRKGKYFVFRSRVQRAEPRGCGDTFREV